MTLPQLIAHRGYASRYPENTLPAIDSALRAGARYVEIDIQLSSDHVPMVFHDVDLVRTTGHAGRITELTSAQLSAIFANETERLDGRFARIPIPTLAAVASHLTRWSGVVLFAEIKTESTDAFGIPAVVTAVGKALEPIAERCVIISYSVPVLEAARAAGARDIGLVLTRYDAATRAAAEALAPGYVICNHQKLPPAPEPLWQGPWQWALYEVIEPELAVALHQRGAALIETMAIGDMLRHPLFKPGGKGARR